MNAWHDTTNLRVFYKNKVCINYLPRHSVFWRLGNVLPCLRGQMSLQLVRRTLFVLRLLKEELTYVQLLREQKMSLLPAEGFSHSFPATAPEFSRCS